jgi:hypothetical protein
MTNRERDERKLTELQERSDHETIKREALITPTASIPPQAK